MQNDVGETKTVTKLNMRSLNGKKRQTKVREQNYKQVFL